MITWATIANEFRLLREELQDVELPSADELDCYKAALAAPGRFHSNLLLADTRRPSNTVTHRFNRSPV